MTEAIPQQFVTDDAEPQVPQDSPATDQGVELREATSGRRGRPRSQEAIDRDEAVYRALSEGRQRTRNEIAEEVGVTGGLTYLSLYRLKHAGRVVRVADGTTRRAWRQTTEEDTLTVDETSETPASAEG